MAGFFHRTRQVVALLTLVLILVGLLAACGDAATAIPPAAPASPTAQAAPTTAVATTVAATTLAPTTVAPSLTTVAPATTSAPTTAPATTAAPTTAVATTPAVAVGQISIVTVSSLHSDILNNDRRVDIYLPPDYTTSTDRYKVLYMNDGDAASNYFNMDKLLGQLYADKQLEKIILVAIYSTSARSNEYGVAGMPNFDGVVGNRADLYSKFVIEELLPYVKKNYRVQEGPANTAFMGFSFGALNAFDLAWEHSDLFGKVGVFSGSFWVRTDNGSPTARQNSRIMHKVVRESPKREGLKMWFSAGTKEETEDRDGNGVIDVIQDTTELIDLLKAKGYQMGTDMAYTQIEGGTHDTTTWVKVLPDFLKWAFPSKNISTVAATTIAPTTALATTPAVAAGESIIDTVKAFHSTFLNNDRRVDIFLPVDYKTSTDRYKVLYMNDGEYAYVFNLKTLLAQLNTDKQLEKIIVVGIFTTEARGSELGVAGIPSVFKGDTYGDKADLYSKFVIEELMPYMKKNYRVQEGPTNTAFLGLSLGGLSAFDLAWRHSDLFGKVGVLSGSFWVRTDESSPAAQKDSRIVHKLVQESSKREGLKMWFSVGTKEVTTDRDGNGVNDMLQDTIELMDLLKAKGYQMGIDLKYTQIEGGYHEAATWVKVLPDFLKWAFPG